MTLRPPAPTPNVLASPTPPRRAVDLEADDLRPLCQAARVHTVTVVRGTRMHAIHDTYRSSGSDAAWQQFFTFNLLEARRTIAMWETEQQASLAPSPQV